ncbi:unnamed protein product [Ectocarpus sp. 12 AP-2014]
MSTAAAARGGGNEEAASGEGGQAEDVKAILYRKEEEVKEMLAPEKEMSDIDALVDKIVEEVSALESRGGEEGAENSDYTFVAAVETAPQFSCPVCKNKKQSNFMQDAKQGDTICLGADGQGCGTVVQDHKARRRRGRDCTHIFRAVHEGSMYRKFEGEADRSHHGPAPNRLYSTAHNMRTWISEGKARWLRNLAEDVEMGLSTVGKDERKTRTAYKDKMKREAFDLINHIAGNCDLHETVTVRAKELFAGWRNVKEHVHQKFAVICACIIAAYREVGTEELTRMFDLRRQQQLQQGLEQDPLYPYVCSECKAGFNAAKALDFHQREVHKSAAAKGRELGGAGPPTPMSEWSLSDARQWLTSVVAALQQPAEYVQSICASLEKSLAAQDKGQRVGAKRKATRTAGQQLMLISLSLLTELCGGNAAAAEKLHHETGRKRSERSRKDKSRVASYNAAQRQNQNVRKPWVAHVNAELNTASKAAAATTAAATAGTAAAATAAAMTTTAVASEAGVATATAASPAVPGAAVVGGSTMVGATTDASAAVPRTTLGVVVGPAASAAGVVG